MERFINIDKVKYVVTKFSDKDLYNIESDDLDFFNSTNHVGLQCNTMDDWKVQLMKEKLIKIAELFEEIDDLNR